MSSKYFTTSESFDFNIYMIILTVHSLSVSNLFWTLISRCLVPSSLFTEG